MVVYNNTGSTGRMMHSSKGNQLKMCLDGYWYKADFLGYEGAAEFASSALLNMTDYAHVDYELCDIEYNDRCYHGCKSKDFLKNTELEIVSIERLFKQEYGAIRHQDSKNSLRDKIKYFVDDTIKITELDDFGAYLTRLLEWDALILNEDRHFKNIAVLRGKDGYTYCPIFDNGAAFLSDTREDYPLGDSVYGLMPKVQAKPFDTDFDKQLEVCRNLYGQQFYISARNLEQSVLERIEAVYGEGIRNRIETVYNHQVDMYPEMIR